VSESISKAIAMISTSSWDLPFAIMDAALLMIAANSAELQCSMVNNMNRLDKELHTRGLVKSRTAAADLITDGKVAINGVVCVKSSREVSDGDLIEIVGELPKYVSRGGLKLEHALDTFGIDLTGKICLDVGASTGGFTDCMLQRGASRVYAVDVGTNQLAPILRDDNRVVSIERCDIRGTTIIPFVNFTAVDVSFISLKLVLPYLCGETVALIKPQFEYGIKHKGVITDNKVQDNIVDDITKSFNAKGVIESPILGKGGNKEFLMWTELL
jgi:23S rRNA (cytidine1920-2'-O)/16S rRNA (cytidine1409-2'-O)-methyltransferase